MLRRLFPMLATAACIMTLSAAAAPRAEAQSTVNPTFRAGQILDGQVIAGDPQVAQQIAAAFVNTIHQFDRRQVTWSIYSPDGRQLYAVLPYLGEDLQYGLAIFGGRVQQGALAGVVMAVGIGMAQGQSIIITRVQYSGGGNAAPVDVVFQQQLTPFDPGTGIGGFGGSGGF